MDLPEFPYHPDPLATESVEASDTQCASCGQRRGFIYRGPAYSVEEVVDCLCPWCIADGTAAEKFAAEFTDVGWGVPPDVPPSVVQEVATRTPGFSGWQQEHWLYHCGDGAAFLGRAGWVELQRYPEAIESLRQQVEVGASEEPESYLRELDADGDTTAYLFQCRHCGSHLAYSDST